MYPGYWSYDGVEIINDARFSTYIRALGISKSAAACACTDLANVLEDAPYETPLDDIAPWYDPAVPESAEFAGIRHKKVTGIASSTGQRTVTDLVGDGGVTGPQRFGPRTVGFTVYLAAASEAGLAYGMSWLAAQLSGEDCNLGDLCFLASCPEGQGTDWDAIWQRYSRTLIQVARVSGPTETNRVAVGRGCTGKKALIAEVEFVLVAEVPCIWGQPVLVAGPTPFVAPAPGGGCDINWQIVGTCTPEADCCPSCGSDPLCTGTTPPRAPIPVLGCGGCVTRLSTAKVEVSVAAGLVPAYANVVPLVTISSGSADARRVGVRMAPRPATGGCPDITECASVGEVNVSWQPAGSTLTLDGRRRAASLACPPAGQSVRVLGPDGGIATWPALPTCGTGVCIEVLADADYVAADASVSVWIVPCSDAG